MGAYFEFQAHIICSKIINYSSYSGNVIFGSRKMGSIQLEDHER